VSEQVAEGHTGRLLVAHPLLGDPNFRRSVVLIVKHGPEGALGLVLNRPSELPAEELVSGLRGLAAAPGVVHLGGPVGASSAICLARLRRRLESGAHGDRPGLGHLFGTVGAVDLDSDLETLGEAVDGVRLFAGYAGWGPGQLEEELDQGGWFVLERFDDDIFTRRPSELWKEVLRRQPRQSLAILATFPEDLATN
jgi:putative transcriptional regulator